MFWASAGSVIFVSDVRCSNRNTKFRMLFKDLGFVRQNPYLIPERYFLHIRRILAEPEVIPEVTVAW